MLPEIVATLVVPLVNVQAPELLEVGGVRVTVPLDVVAGAIVNAPSVGVPGETVKVAVVLAAVKFEVAASLAVMVVVPTPTTVTVLPETVATAVLELVYENAPVLLDDGAVRANGATPYD